MYDKRVFLKVKVKSLAEEAKIIRKEEKKNLLLKQELADHRKKIVRFEARHALLAYCFLRGREYRDIEPKCHVDPNWAKIRQMVERYGILQTEDMSYHDWKKAQKELMIKFDDWVGKTVPL
jgi:hypothetical protein